MSKSTKGRKFLLVLLSLIDPQEILSECCCMQIWQRLFPKVLALRCSMCTFGLPTLHTTPPAAGHKNAGSKIEKGCCTGALIEKRRGQGNYRPLSKCIRALRAHLRSVHRCTFVSFGFLQSA